MGERIKVINRALVNLFLNNDPTKYIDHAGPLERDEAEERDDLVQLVSYVAVVTDSGKIAIYERRKDGEKGLAGKLSIGIGGHVDDSDASPAVTAFREIKEEMGLEVSPIKFLGTYYDDSDDVGKKHLGFFYYAKISDELAEKVSGEENVKFVDEITPEMYARLEKWSKALLEMLNDN